MPVSKHGRPSDSPKLIAIGDDPQSYPACSRSRSSFGNYSQLKKLDASAHPEAYPPSFTDSLSKLTLPLSKPGFPLSCLPPLISMDVLCKLWRRCCGFTALFGVEPRQDKLPRVGQIDVWWEKHCEIASQKYSTRAPVSTDGKLAYQVIGATKTAPGLPCLHRGIYKSLI